MFSYFTHATTAKNASDTCHEDTFHNISISPPNSNFVMMNTDTITDKCQKFLDDVQIIKTKEDLFSYMGESWSTSPYITMRIIFYIRDHQQGLGNKNFFKWAMEYLMLNGHKDVIIKNFHNIPVFGYYKDFFMFFNTPLEGAMIKFYCDQLMRDVTLMYTEPDKMSLAGKWAPTEKCSIDRQFNAVAKFCAYLKITPKQYRKNYIVPMRAKLQVVETLMCKRQFNVINYEVVPHKAYATYLRTFKKRDKTRLRDYVEHYKETKKEAYDNYTQMKHEHIQSMNIVKLVEDPRYADIYI